MKLSLRWPFHGWAFTASGLKFHIRVLAQALVSNKYSRQPVHLFVPLFIFNIKVKCICYQHFCCIVLLLCSLFTNAQRNSEWYLSKILNDNNGLPQNSVRSMYYDKKTDFLWLATEAGLARYDGQNTRVFDKRDMPYLQSMRIHNLIPSVNGEVLGSNLLGEIFTIKANYPEAAVEKYIGKPNDIIYRLGNIKSIAGLAMEAQALAGEKIRTANQAATLWLNNGTWIGQTDSNIFLANNNRIIYRWPGYKPVGLIFLERGNRVYAINNSGEGYCLDVVTKAQIPLVIKSSILASGKAKFFYNKLNDNALLLKGNKVYEVIFTGSIVTTSLVATLPKVPGFITDLIFDKTRRYLFLATNATGLYIYHRSSFKVYVAEGDDIVNDNYACVVTDSQHVFTSQSRLFNLEDGTSKAVPVSIGSERAIASDINGNIWAVRKPSFIRFNIESPGQALTVPLADTNLIQTIFRANNDRIWFSTSAQLSFADNNLIKPFLNYPSLQAAFHFIGQTPAGVLMGMNHEGIFIIDTITKKLVPIIQDADLSQGRFFLADNDNRCWIATYGNGIFVYNLNTKKLTHLPVDDRGYLQYSHAFIDDNKGHFLVPTNKGLFRLGKSNLLQVEQFAETPLCYQYFDVNDGLLTNEFNGGCQPAYNRLPTGDVLLPALQGLVRVKISALPYPDSSKIFVDFIESRLRQYKLSERMYFTSGERVLSWNLGFTQWDKPNGQGIFYRLDGSGNWQRLMVGERKILLSELPGGRHRLEIKYQYGLEKEEVTIVAYSFTVGKFYYETIWFWLIILLVLIGIFFMLVRLRSRQLKQKNKRLQDIIKENTKELSDKNAQLQETLLDLNEALKGLQENSIFKNRLIGLLGHDLLVPLRFIARVANHLHDEGATLTPKAASENSAEIKNTATELLYLGESLIQWIKLLEGSFRLIVQPINIHNLVEETMQVHRSIATVKNNFLICDIPSEITVLYDAVFIKVILHNLLLNANKFTAGGSISIEAALHGSELQIQVADTGIGMSETMVTSLNDFKPVQSHFGTHKEGGFGRGYMLIIDLLRFAEGRLVVESSVGGGTVVKFTLPIEI